MKLLIGNTGLIGTTLRDYIKFDYEFNSSNINELLQISNTGNDLDIYLACLPANKWIVNQNAQKDLENIFSILNIISKKEYRNIILCSTIDIYNSAPLLSNEDYEPNIESLNYGSNRLLFERLVTKDLTYDKLLILRLPALFGNHLKKNILFDLLNDNQISKINYNSKFQWYNLENISLDIVKYLSITNDKVCIANLFTEPIDTYMLLKFFNKDKSDVNGDADAIVYDFTTKFSESNYICGKQTVLSDIHKFIIQYKK
jgi:hypothetical protein